MSPLLPALIVDVDCVVELADVQYLVVCRFFVTFRVHVVAIILLSQLRLSSLDSHPRPIVSACPTDWGCISTWDFLAACIDPVLKARNPPLCLHV